MNPDPLSSPAGDEGDASGATFPPDVLALALLQLRAAGDHDAADALVRMHTGDGGGGDAPVAKSCGMSSAVGSAGGFLVSPPGGRRRMRRRAKKTVARILKSLE